MNVTTDRLFQIIGEQAVELMLLRLKLAASQQETLDALAENTRLAAEFAAQGGEAKTNGP